MVFSTDWWLKRAFKFALKRYLGRLLRSEVDLEQLDVQLGKGTLELRGVLLNCDYLNEQMGSPLWEVTAGYVGCMRLVIPLTNLSTEACSLELDEALLTVKPRATPGDKMCQGDSSLAVAEGEPGDGPAALFDMDAGLGPAAITDGVARIAGGIETILQRLRVQAARVTVRVELPPQSSSSGPASLVVARLEQFTYAGETAPPTALPTATASTPAMQLQKLLTFRGLTMELFEDVDDQDAPTQPEEDFSVVPRGAAAGRAAGLAGALIDSKSALEGAMRTPVASFLGSPFAGVAARGRALAAGEMDRQVQGSISRSEGDWEGDGDGWVDGGDFGSVSEGMTGTCSMPDESRHVIICSSNGIGCSGTLRLHLLWRTNGQARPRVAADLSLDPLQIQLHPHHLPLLSHLASCLGDTAASADSPAQLDQSAMRASQQPATRSFLADILLPDPTALAQDFIYQSWRQDAEGAAESEFFDAQSVLGSIKSGLSTFVSASTAGAAGAAGFFSTTSTGPGGSEELMGGLAHPPLGSELGGGQLKVETSDLSLILFYPEFTSFSAVLSEDGNAVSDFRPRLSVEVGDLTLNLEASAEGSSATLSVYRLEAVEYIPVLGRENAATAAALAETVCIPEALPPIAGEARPAPSFAGVSIQPLRRSLNCSMLSQMSTHSAHVGPAATTAPQVQIWPVLCCGGGRRSETSTPSLAVQASTGKAAQKGVAKSAESEGLMADAKLKPLTLWLGLPLLQRMQSFLEPLMLQSTVAAIQALRSPAPNQRAAVSSAINSILEDLQGFDEPGAAVAGQSAPGKEKLRLSVAAAHICAIVLIPPMSSSRTPLNHGYSSLVIDLFAPVSAQTPTVTLTRSPSQANTASPVWDATAAFSRSKAYLLRTEAAGIFDYGRQYGQEPTSLSATCIVDVDVPLATGADVTKEIAAALTLHVTCKPGAESSRSLLSAAWDWAKRKAMSDWQAGTKEEKSDQVDEVQFQNAASASSPLFLQFRAPDICINVSQADLAAVMHLGAALVQWQADAAAATALAAGITIPVTFASQTTVMLECGLRCNLQRFTQGVDVCMSDRTGAIFQMDSRELRLFSVTGMDGQMNAATLALEAGGLNVRGERGRAALLTCADGLPAGLDLLHFQRPRRPGILETEVLACTTLRGITLATEPGDPTCSWMQRLGAFFTLAMEPNELETRAAEATPVDWTVQLRDCALRDEPRDADDEGAVAAVLLLGGLRWGQTEGGIQEVKMRSLSLFAADAASRAPGFSPAEAVDLPNMQLLACGYVCLAQEGGLTLTIKPPAIAEETDDITSSSTTSDQQASEELSQASQAQPFMGVAPKTCSLNRTEEPPETSRSGGEGGGGDEAAQRTRETAMWRTELTNQRLYCPLTRVAWRRLNALAAQWSVCLGAGTDAPTRDLAPPDETDGPRQESTRAAGVAVMDGVDEHAFRRRDQSAGNNDLASSTFMDDYKLEETYTEDEEEAGAPGGAPVLIEDFFRNQLVVGQGGELVRPVSTEELGVWYQAPDGEESPGPPVIQEEYVKPPPPGYRPPTGQGSALGSLPENYAVPVSRFVLRNFRIVIALCRSDESGPGGEASPATSTRLELDLEDVCVQADTFHSEGPHARRLALSVRSIEFRDRALRTDASPAWAKIFSHHVGARSPRDPTSCLLNVELESVRPVEGGTDEELRLRVSCLPVRLRVDQDVVTFLQAFFAPPSEAETAPVNISDPGSPSGESSAKEEAGGVYFQRCEIRPLTIVVDYKPRRLDVAALRAGNLAEVLNVAGWSNVAVQLPAIRIAGLSGWDALGALVAQQYLNHIASSQVHKFVAGIKPIQSIVRIGAAAGQLLAIPADALRGRPDSAATRNSAPLSRQIQRGVTGLVRAILAEMLGMSAGALGGIHLVLTGHSAASASSSQPSNVSDGLRQAAGKLSAGFGEMGEALRAPFRSAGSGEGDSPEQLPSGGVGAAAVRALRATPGAIAKPLSEGAAAARCALLGARNSLDPDRLQERRLAN